MSTFNFQPKQGNVSNGTKVIAIANDRIVSYGDAPVGTMGMVKSYVGKRKMYIPDTDSFKMLDCYMVAWGTNSARDEVAIDEFKVISESGNTITEFAMLLPVVAIVAIGIVALLTGNTSVLDAYNAIGNLFVSIFGM